MDADVMQAPHDLGRDAQQQPDNWVRGGGGGLVLPEGIGFFRHVLENIGCCRCIPG